MQTQKKNDILPDLRPVQVEFLSNWIHNNGFRGYSQKALLAFLKAHNYKVIINKKKHYYEYPNNGKGIEVICLRYPEQSYPDFATKDNLKEALWSCVKFVLNGYNDIWAAFISDEALVYMQPYSKITNWKIVFEDMSKGRKRKIFTD